MTTHWYVLPINPEPWAVGPLGITKRKGKLVPYIGPNSQLVAFQEAIKEFLAVRNVSVYDEPFRLQLFFWQRRDLIERAIGRNSRRKEFDVTNMVKATEDALQGVMFKNDNQTWEVQGTVVERGENVIPKIVVAIEPFEGFNPDRIPMHVWLQIQGMEAQARKPIDNVWRGPEQGELL